jgi:hypothetical protein
VATVGLRPVPPTFGDTVFLALLLLLLRWAH